MRDENFSETAPTGEGAADNPFLKLTRFGVPDDDAESDFDDGDDASASQARTDDVGATDGVPSLRGVGSWDDIRDTAVSWSEGKNKSSDVARCDGTWESFAREVILRPHAWIRHRDNKGSVWTFTPSAMRDYSAVVDDKGRWAGKNLNDGNVAEITVLIFDIDNKEGAIQRLEDIAPRLRELGVAFGWYSTSSSTVERPKWRLVLSIEPFLINGVEDAAVYGAAYIAVGEALSLGFDPTCQNVSRFYYGPAFVYAEPFKCSKAVGKDGGAAYLAATKAEYPGWRKQALAKAGAFSGFEPGGLLNFQEIAEHIRPSVQAKQTASAGKGDARNGGARTQSAAEAYVADENLKTPNLRKFVYTCRQRFQIVDAAEALEGTTADWGGRDKTDKDKAWSRCVNDGGEITGRPHTDRFDRGNPTAFWVQNARNGKEFVIGCGTDGCREHFAKKDANGNTILAPDGKPQLERLRVLDLLCIRWGVKDAAELLEFCDDVEAARRAFEGRTTDGRRTVYTNHGFNTRLARTIEAMKEDKLPDGSPYFYAGVEGAVSRVREVESDGLTVLKAEPLRPGQVSSELNRIIDWQRMIDLKGRSISVTAPGDVIGEVSASIRLALPQLNGIVRAPFITKDGELVTAAGYHNGSGLYHYPVAGFVPLPIAPHEITKDNAIAARDRVLSLLRDFSFTDKYDGTSEGPIYLDKTDADGFRLPNLERGKAARAGALAMILHPHIMALFDGVSPLYLLDATLPGSGKGTLADTVTLISEGREAPKRKLYKESEETHKQITTALTARARTYVLDNIKVKMADDALENALTSGVWNGRILGKTEEIEMRMRMQFIATMNNGSLGLDMLRRVLPIRLQPDVTHMKDRKEPFRYEFYSEHVLAHRAELLRDLHLIILYWFHKTGCKRGTARLASFNPYAAVMSGILEAVEVVDFLGNLDAFYDGGGDAGPEQAFVADWWRTHGDKVTPATQLFNDFLDNQSGVLGSTVYAFRYPELSGFRPDARQPAQSLGYALARLKGRVFDVDGATVTVTRPSKESGGTQGYQLAKR